MLLWILVWCINLGIVCSLSDFSEEYPNPQKQWRMCGRPKASYVCDPEFILDRGDVERLDELVKVLKTSTACLCEACSDEAGIQIGIFLKSNLTQEAILDDTGKSLAETIRESWSLGNCNDDIIIILFTQSNISDFSLGASVQSILTEDIASQILSDCRIHFSSGYFYQGLESIVNSFSDVIRREQRQSSEATESYNELMIGLLIGFGILLLVVVVAALAVHFRQVKRRKKSCSTIYENGKSKPGRFKQPTDQEEQLEKLNKKSDADTEDV